MRSAFLSNMLSLIVDLHCKRHLPSRKHQPVIGASASTYVRPASVSSCPALWLSGSPALCFSGSPALRLSGCLGPGGRACMTGGVLLRRGTGPKAICALLKLNKKFPVEQFEATVSRSTVPSPPLRRPSARPWLPGKSTLQSQQSRQLASALHRQARSHSEGGRFKV